VGRKEGIRPNFGTQGTLPGPPDPAGSHMVAIYFALSFFGFFFSRFGASLLPMSQIMAQKKI
jgi:hypothetical protein